MTRFLAPAIVEMNKPDGAKKKPCRMIVLRLSYGRVRNREEAVLV